MKRTLIVFLVAVALLAGILLKKRSNDKSLSNDAPALDSTWKANVTSLHLIKVLDTSKLELKGGKWQVAKDSFLVDTAKINKTLGHIFRVQNRELVSNSAARLAEYGLDSMEAKHVIAKDATGKTLADIMVGKTSGADYNSTYWKWATKPEVYRTPGNFTWEIATKDNDWKDRKLFGALAKDVKFIEASWIDSTGTFFAYKLESLTDSTWKMVAPQDSNRVKNAVASEMASRFTELTIDEFVTVNDSNAAKVSLDTPAVWVKVGLKTGSTLELKASKPLNMFAYVQHPAHKDLVKITAARLDGFKKKPFELLEAPPAPAASPSDSSNKPSAAVKIEPAANIPKQKAGIK